MDLREIKSEEKINTLGDKYGIIATEEIRREVDEMCNYSDVLEKNALNAGIKTGIHNEKRDAAYRMIRAGKYSDNEISEISGLSLKQVQELKKEESVLA